MIALDASALTALLLRETGHEIVAATLPQSAISTVNLAEVITRMARERVAARALVTRLLATGLSVVDFDQPQALLVADIRDAARRAGVGLADCCCLALGLHRGYPVLTADPVWPSLGLNVDVRLIR
jgi:ribonuclease VapC